MPGFAGHWERGEYRLGAGVDWRDSGDAEGGTVGETSGGGGEEKGDDGTRVNASSWPHPGGVLIVHPKPIVCLYYFL